MYVVQTLTGLNGETLIRREPNQLGFQNASCAKTHSSCERKWRPCSNRQGLFNPIGRASCKQPGLVAALLSLGFTLYAVILGFYELFVFPPSLPRVTRDLTPRIHQ